MPVIKPPEQQQNRWKYLSFQVDFYCYCGTILSRSISLYLIAVINLKSLLFDISTKVIPWAEPCQTKSTRPCQFPIPHTGKHLTWSFLSKTSSSEHQPVLKWDELWAQGHTLSKVKPHSMWFSSTFILMWHSHVHKEVQIFIVSRTIIWFCVCICICVCVCFIIRVVASSPKF